MEPLATESDGLAKLTIRQVAQRMGVCERTIANWRKQGLPFVKIGRKCWILLNDLTVFIESHRIEKGE